MGRFCHARIGEKANTGRDGSGDGAVKTLVAALRDRGCFIPCVDVVALVTTTAGQVRFAVEGPGSVRRALRPLNVTAATASDSNSFFESWSPKDPLGNPVGVRLAKGQKLLVWSAKAELMDLTCWAQDDETCS